MALVDSREYTWAVLYIIGCSKDPFIKAPVIPDTVLAAQAVVGLTEADRFVNCNGSIGNGVYAQYKPYMFCGPEFFSHVDNIVDIMNWFYNYLRSHVDPDMARETAYAVSTSIFPAMTDSKRPLQPVLSPLEVKKMTNSNLDVDTIVAITLKPHPLMGEDVIK